MTVRLHVKADICWIACSVAEARRWACRTLKHAQSAAESLQRNVHAVLHSGTLKRSSSMLMDTTSS